MLKILWLCFIVDTVCNTANSSSVFLHSLWRFRVTKASLILARMLFPQCHAIRCAKERHFSGTWSVTTARWGTVCAMSCYLSRISYELFTKCVTLNVTLVHFAIKSWQVVTPWKKVFEDFKIISQRHDTHYFTWPALPRIPQHTRIITSCSALARQIACHGVNRSSCQCEACLMYR